MTHFGRARAKNTEEMIKMADLLRAQYEYLPHDLSIVGCSLVAYLEEVARSLQKSLIRKRREMVIPS